MTIEAAQTINNLNTSYPRSTDLLREGDDHIRMIKATLQRTFPRIDGTVNFSTAKLNTLDSISDVSGGSMKITVPTLSPDVTAGTRTSGVSGTLRLITNTDREVNFHIPQDRADTVVTNKTSNVTTWDWGNINLYNIGNVTAGGTVTAGNLGTGGTLTANTVHATGVVNSDHDVNASGGVTGRTGVTVGAGNVGGSTGSSLAFFAGDQTSNTQLMVKDYGGGAQWVQNWNYTGAVKSMDFNGLDIRCGTILSKGSVNAGGSWMDTSGNISGSAWNNSDLKGFIVNNCLNDITYQSDNTIHQGQAGNTVTVPGGAFMTGIHQGATGTTTIWIEDLYYRNVVKKYLSGASFVINHQ